MGVIISVISQWLHLPLLDYEASAWSRRKGGSACSPFSPCPLQLSHPTLPSGNCSLCAPFCQGRQIGQISVMLKNWPISWQGTLTAVSVTAVGSRGGR